MFASPSWLSLQFISSTAARLGGDQLSGGPAVVDEGKRVGRVARDLDLTETALRTWVN